MVTRAPVAIRSPICTAQVHIELTHVSCYIMHRVLLDPPHSDLGPEHRAGLRLAPEKTARSNSSFASLAVHTSDFRYCTLSSCMQAERLAEFRACADWRAASSALLCQPVR